MTVKVTKHTHSHTTLQSWETYWFSCGKQKTFGIEKQDGIFKFWAKHCKSLKEAKQYIANFVNSGGKLQNI